jgi:DNA polymerase IV
MIACFSLPYFVAQIERRNDRQLAQHPLAIGGQPWEAHPIFAFSHEVARRGVRPGIPLRQAHLLAPQAHFMPANIGHYQMVSGEVGDVMGDMSALVEIADWWQTPTQAAETIGRSLPAHYFADLGDIPPQEWVPFARQVGRFLREQTAFSPAIGIARQKFTAQVAATIARPNHLRPIIAGTEAAFLATRSLRFLPLDQKTSRRLHLLGIRTLGDLASLPPAALWAQFGRQAVCWQQWAQGQDGTPVQARPAERLETVSYQFDNPLTSLVSLSYLLHQSVQELAVRLREAGLCARKLSLTWETEAGFWQHQERTLRQPTAAANCLADTLKQLANQESFTAGITALTVFASELSPAVPQQLTLFSARPKSEGSYGFGRSLTARYPAGRFYRPVLTEANHPLPERRFDLLPLPNRQ